MFAVRFDRFGPPDVLTLGSCPEPHAGPGEMRVRVAAAGVSPVDLALRAGKSPSSATLALPHVPGVDAAGTVDEIGDGVIGVVVGDEVFGTVDVARLGGATAEFAVLRFWARKPAALSWAEAGAAGTSVETATRVLDVLGVGDGDVVLIDGAAGGVGNVAGQLALARGASVIGRARTVHHAFVAELGATPVESGTGPRPVDHAIDMAGAGSLPELVELTRSVVTIADFDAPKLGVRLSMGELAGEPDGRHGLAVAAALAEAGRFRTPLRGVFPFDRAAGAHTLAERGPRWGKIALTARMSVS
ncbi:MAG TPA: NADP-dependent oxidoreductase [Pseudonocardiaceae bacterium]|nr:NADP-dependent oxidoreductase [Pseudonocardiaceae bacterium]